MGVEDSQSNSFPAVGNEPQKLFSPTAIAILKTSSRQILY
jgi:hypothetical protein